MKITYKVDNDYYEIEPEREIEFLTNARTAGYTPKKLISYKVENDIYDIEPEREQEFLTNAGKANYAPVKISTTDAIEYFNTELENNRNNPQKYSNILFNRSKYLADKQEFLGRKSVIMDEIRTKPIPQEQRDRYEYKESTQTIGTRNPKTIKQHLDAIRAEAYAELNYNPDSVMKSLEVIKDGIDNGQITENDPDYYLAKKLYDKYYDIKDLNIKNWTDRAEKREIKSIFKWYDKEGAQEKLNYDKSKVYGEFKIKEDILIEGLRLLYESKSKNLTPESHNKINAEIKRLQAAYSEFEKQKIIYNKYFQALQDEIDINRQNKESLEKLGIIEKAASRGYNILSTVAKPLLETFAVAGITGGKIWDEYSRIMSEGGYNDKDRITPTLKNYFKEVLGSNIDDIKYSGMAAGAPTNLLSKAATQFARSIENIGSDVTYLASHLTNDKQFQQTLRDMKAKTEKAYSEAPVENEDIIDSAIVGLADLAGSMAFGGAASKVAGVAGKAVGLTAKGLNTVNKAATVSAWSLQGAGSIQRELDAAGIDRKISLPLSLAGGLAYAGAEYLQFDTLIKGAKPLYEKELKKNLLNYTKKFPINTILETGTEAFQRAITDGTEIIARTTQEMLKNIKLPEKEINLIMNVYEEGRQVLLSMIAAAGLGSGIAAGQDIKLRRDIKKFDQKIYEKSQEQVTGFLNKLNGLIHNEELNLSDTAKQWLTDTRNNILMEYNYNSFADEQIKNLSDSEAQDKLNEIYTNISETPETDENAEYLKILNLQRQKLEKRLGVNTQTVEIKAGVPQAETETAEEIKDTKIIENIKNQIISNPDNANINSIINVDNNDYEIVDIDRTTGDVTVNLIPSNKELAALTPPSVKINIPELINTQETGEIQPSDAADATSDDETGQTEIGENQYIFDEIEKSDMSEADFKKSEGYNKLVEATKNVKDIPKGEQEKTPEVQNLRNATRMVKINDMLRDLSKLTNIDEKLNKLYQARTFSKDTNNYRFIEIQNEINKLTGRPLIKTDKKTVENVDDIKNQFMSLGINAGNDYANTELKKAGYTDEQIKSTIREWNDEKDNLSKKPKNAIEKAKVDLSILKHKKPADVTDEIYYSEQISYMDKLITDVETGKITAQEFRDKIEADATFPQLKSGMVKNHEMQKAVNESNRTGKPVTYIEFDVNNLSGMNLAAGSHEKANEYFSQLIDIIQKHFPADAVFERHGGDELGLILRGMTQADAETIMNEKVLPELYEWNKKNNLELTFHPKLASDITTKNLPFVNFTVTHGIMQYDKNIHKTIKDWTTQADEKASDKKKNKKGIAKDDLMVYINNKGLSIEQFLQRIPQINEKGEKINESAITKIRDILTGRTSGTDSGRTGQLDGRNGLLSNEITSGSSREREITSPEELHYGYQLRPRNIQTANKNFLISGQNEDGTFELFNQQNRTTITLSFEDIQKDYTLIPEYAPSEDIKNIPVGSIKVYPELMQFKSDVDKKGVTKKLKNVEVWDSAKAGNVTVWVADKDQIKTIQTAAGEKTFNIKKGDIIVADGHHRIELADRLDQKTLNAIILRESDGISVEDARRIAAENNIAQGNASIQDAAKFIRENNYTLEQFKRLGFPLDNSLAERGYHIAQLTESVFNEAMNTDTLKDTEAAAIGEVLKGYDNAQMQILNMIKNGKYKPKAATFKSFLRNILQEYKSNKDLSNESDETMDLFGNIDDNSLKIAEFKAGIIAEVKKELNKLKNLLFAMSRVEKGAEREISKNELLKMGYDIDALAKNKKVSTKKIAKQYVAAIDELQKNWIYNDKIKDALNEIISEKTAAESNIAKWKTADDDINKITQLVLNPENSLLVQTLNEKKKKDDDVDFQFADENNLDKFGNLKMGDVIDTPRGKFEIMSNPNDKTGFMVRRYKSKEQSFRVDLEKSSVEKELFGDGRIYHLVEKKDNDSESAKELNFGDKQKPQQAGLGFERDGYMFDMQYDEATAALTEQDFQRNKSILEKVFKGIGIIRFKSVQDYTNRLNSILKNNQKVNKIFDNKGLPLGFVYKNNMYIHPEAAAKNTMWHEAGHIFTNILKKYNPEAFQALLNIIKIQGKKYIDEIKANKNYSHLSYDEKAEEALQLAIQDDAARFVDEKSRQNFIKKLIHYIKGLINKLSRVFKINKATFDLTADEISKMTLPQIKQRIIDEITGVYGQIAKLDNTQKQINKTPFTEADIKATAEDIKKLKKEFDETKAKNKNIKKLDLNILNDRNNLVDALTEKVPSDSKIKNILNNLIDNLVISGIDKIQKLIETIKNILPVNIREKIAKYYQYIKESFLKALKNPNIGLSIKDVSGDFNFDAADYKSKTSGNNGIEGSEAIAAAKYMVDKTNPLFQLHELLEIAEDADVSVSAVDKIKRRPNAVGVFKHGASGQFGGVKPKIEIIRALFNNPPDGYTPESVLAHEIGHMIDYADLSTIKEKSLTARLKKMFGFLGIANTLLNEKKYREELINLTYKWNPFDLDANNNYKRYRFSNRELFAEFVSVYLNRPDMVDEYAPNFTVEFEKFITGKPEISDTIKEINERINKTPKERVRTLVDRSSAKIIQKTSDLNQAITEQRVEARKINKKSLTELFVDMFKPINDVLNKAGVKMKGVIEDDYNIIPRLANFMHLSGATAERLREFKDAIQDIKILFDDKRDKIINPITKKKEGHFDLYLIARRISEQKKELANPFGITSDNADYVIEVIKDDMGADFEKFEKSAEALKNIFDKMLKESLEAGMLSQEQIDKFQENNPYYVPFEIIEAKLAEMDTNKIVESGGKNYYTRKGSFGTPRQMLETIASMIVKTTRANEINKIKKIFFELNQFEKGIALPAEYKITGQTFDGKMLKDPIPKANYTTVWYKDNGETKAFYLRDDIHRVYNSLMKAGGEFALPAGMLNTMTKYYKHFFVNFNVFFAFNNALRDFQNQLKHAGLSPKQMVMLAPTYTKGLREAFNELFTNKGSAVFREMYENKVLSVHNYLDPLTHSNLSEDERLLKSYDVEYDKLNALPENADMQEIIKYLYEKFKNNPLKIISAFVQMSEYASKYSGWVMNADVENLERRAFLARTYFGSPDYMLGGSHRALMNQVFMFGNIGMQGWARSYSSWAKDFNKNPVGALTKFFTLYGGTIALNYLIRLIAETFDDDDDDELTKNITLYDWKNYVVIPIWLADGKTKMIRIPIDQTTKFFNSVAYTFLDFALERDGKKFIRQMFDDLVGDYPYAKVNEPLKDFISIFSNYDFYRRRQIFDSENGTLTENAIDVFKYMLSDILAPTPFTYRAGEGFDYKLPLYKQTDYGVFGEGNKKVNELKKQLKKLEEDGNDTEINQFLNNINSKYKSNFESDIENINFYNKEIKNLKKKLESIENEFETNQIENDIEELKKELKKLLLKYA